MALIETWRRHDLDSLTQMEYLDGVMFTQDNMANMIGVELYDSGVPYSGGGSVSANVIRSDGGTVAVTGTISGNKASVTLPQAAYASVGPVFIILKVTVGTAVTTVGAFCAVIYASTTSTTIDPGALVASVQQLIEDLEDAVDSFADYSGLLAMIAPTYSTSGTYAVGDYVIYNNGLYRCTTAISSGESWTAAHWTAVKVGNELIDLKGAMDQNELLSEYGDEALANELSEISGLKAGKWINGYYTTPSAGSSIVYNDRPTYMCTIIPVSEGDYYALNAYGYQGDYRQYAFADSSMKVVSRASANNNGFVSGIVPSGVAYLVVNNRLANQTSGFFAYAGKPPMAQQKYLYANDDTDILDGITWASGDGFSYARWSSPVPAGTYSMFINATTNRSDYDNVVVRVLDQKTFNSDHVIYTKSVVKGMGTWFTFTVNSPFWSIYLFAGGSTSSASGYSVTVASAKLYRGNIYDTTGTYDMAGQITAALTKNGICELPAGDFLISEIKMPDGSKLIGCGDKTRLLFDEDATGTAIEMGSGCTIRDITLLGAEEDITLPDSDFTPEEGSTDLVSGATQSTGDGWVRYVLSNPLPPGDYKLYINATSDKSVDYIVFKAVETETYSSNRVIYNSRTMIPKGQAEELEFSINEACKSIWIFAGADVPGSSGYTVTIATAPVIHSMTSIIGNRHGISWQNPENMAGIISGARISSFSGSGILCMDTDTPVDRNLVISDCFVRNCGAGIYVRKDSEFLKISNNTITRNFYGILNRGGNNNISNCGIDKNVVGIQIDQDEGGNGGHGVIHGCSINHSDNNTGYGLVIKNTGREMVSACNFYYSGVRLESTNGNVISACGFGRNTPIDIVGGTCSIFSGCMFIGTGSGNSPITISNNDKAQFVNCYTRGGTAVNPRA